MELLTLFLLGLVIGIFSAFFGVGGGVLMIPTFYSLYPKMPPQTAIGCSLIVIFFNSIINTVNFLKQDLRPDKIVIFTVGLTAIVGVYLGGQATTILDPKTIKIFFASILILVVLRVVFYKKSNFDSQNFLNSHHIQLKCIFSGLLGGATSGLTGLGGGAVLVPLFISLLRIPFKLVSLYSNASMVFITFFGTLTFMTMDFSPSSLENIPFFFAQVGHVNFAIAFSVFIGAFFTSKLGVNLGMQFDPDKKRYLFAGLLTFISIKIFLSV